MSSFTQCWGVHFRARSGPLKVEDGGGRGSVVRSHHAAKPKDCARLSEGRMSSKKGRRFDGWPRRAVLPPLAIAALVLVALAGSAAAQERFHSALNPQYFPVPSVLVPNVVFWREIFSRHTSSQTVIHDNWHVDVVFAVVDVSDLEQTGTSPFVIERVREERVQDEVEKYQRVLRRLAGDAGADASTADVERVRALYANSSRRTTDFRAAIDRVRGQGGLRDTFAEAIRTSGMFMPGVERILQAHGVPLEVRCLPFVESMYNFRARSRVGASGVWQFTASTGRRFLQMNSAVDARHDVWLAGEAAARMLRADYARVQSWPLALTGYNHGIAGMVRAVRLLGTTDIGVIAEQYESPSFGFASRNFYSEFVAAVTVFADRATLFPGVEPLPAVTFDQFSPGRFVSLLDLASLTDSDTETLATLNPALDDEVMQGRLLVPGDYPLRVPAGARARFADAFAQLPPERKAAGQLNRTYRVGRGDTLGAIARRFGTTPSALQRANGLARANRLRVGQVLEIGPGGGVWSPLVWKPTAPTARTTTATANLSDRVHVIRSGETLYQVAKRYGLTVAAIVAANKLVSPDRVAVGTVLALPAGP
jgi:membrane-bound lytic murein transglycosylase D